MLKLTNGLSHSLYEPNLEKLPDLHQKSSLLLRGIPAVSTPNPQRVAPPPDFTPHYRQSLKSTPAQNQQRYIVSNTPGDNLSLTVTLPDDLPGIFGVVSSSMANNNNKSNNKNNNNNNNYEKYNHNDNRPTVLSFQYAAAAAGNLSMLSSRVSTPEVHNHSPAEIVQSAPVRASVRPAPSKFTTRCTPLKPPKKYRADDDVEGCEILRCKRSLDFGGKRRAALTGVTLEVTPESGDAPPSGSTPDRGRPRESIEKRNQRERRRVKQINTTFVALQNQLPSFCWEQRPGFGTGNGSGAVSVSSRNYKPSKVDTLRTAIDYIRSLQELVAEHDALVSAQCLSLLQSDDNNPEEREGGACGTGDDVTSTSGLGSARYACMVASSKETIENNFNRTDSFFEVMTSDDVTGTGPMRKTSLSSSRSHDNGESDKSFMSHSEALSFIDFESWIA